MPEETTNTVPSDVLNAQDHGETQIRLKVLGKDATRPLRDVIATAQKHEAADQRLAEAHAQAEEFAQEREIASLLRQGAKGNDRNAAARAMILAGFEEAGVKKAFGLDGGPPAGNQEETDDGYGEEPTVNPRLEVALQKIEEMHRELNQAKAEKTRASRDQQVEEALDKFPGLGTMVSQMSQDAKKYVLRLAKYAVAERHQLNPVWGDRVIQQGLSDLKIQLESMKLTTPPKETTTLAGLGESETAGFYLDADAVGILDRSDKSKTKDNDPFSTANVLRKIASHFTGGGK